MKALTEVILGKLKTKDSLNLERKIFHCLIGLAVYLPYIVFEKRFPSMEWYCFLLLITGTTEFLRLKFPQINEFLLTNYSDIFRKSEANSISSVIPFLTGLLVSTTLFPVWISHIAVGCQVLADPVASYFGIQFGKRKIWDGKTLEGFFACMGVSVGFCLLVSFGMLHLAPWKVVILALSTGLVTALAEAYPIRLLDDNLRISLFTGTWLLILSKLLLISY